MSQTAFTHAYRLLVCANCGASLSLGTEGGSVSCRYCGATTQARPRAEAYDIAALRSAPAADEYDRYQRLKAQQDRPRLPPPGLEHLVVAGGLPGQLVPQAQAEWQATLKEIHAGAPVGVQERFFFLTFLLAQGLSRSGGADADPRRRGILETAIETLAAPQHRFQLRALLARDAVRIGDLVSAEAWLAGCDPRSYDIEVDSDYRLAAAYLATARRDWPGVLQLLGQRVGDVPIAQSSSGLAAVVRANALERSGRVPEAIEQLRPLAGDDLDDLFSIQRMNASLDLCPASVAALVAERERPAAAAPPKKRMGSPVSIPFALIGVGMIVAGFFVDPNARTDDDMMQLNRFFWMLGGFFALSGISSGFLVRRLGASMGLSAASQASWKKAPARIVSVQSTGWVVNDNPQLALRLQVFYQDRPVYEVDTKLCVPPHQVGQIKPGVSISVRVDPDNPQNVSASG